jgi:hypothetical protein
MSVLTDTLSQFSLLPLVNIHQVEKSYKNMPFIDAIERVFVNLYSGLTGQCSQYTVLDSVGGLQDSVASILYFT